MKTAVLSALIAVLTAFLAGFVALLIAWVQSRIARRAVDAQERSIYLTLIERRAKWLDYAISTWSIWIDQQEQRIEAIVTNQSLPTDEPLGAIGNCRREARWLFGPEMDDFLAKLEIAVQEYSSARLAVRELGVMEPSERIDADAQKRRDNFARTLGRMTTMRGDLSNLSRPYMFVGDIKAKALPRLSDDPQQSDGRKWFRRR